MGDRIPRPVPEVRAVVDFRKTTKAVKQMTETITRNLEVVVIAVNAVNNTKKTKTRVRARPEDEAGVEVPPNAMVLLVVTDIMNVTAANSS